LFEKIAKKNWFPNFNWKCNF